MITIIKFLFTSINQQLKRSAKISNISKTQLISLAETFREISVGLFITFIISTIFEDKTFGFAQLALLVVASVIWYINHRILLYI